MVTSSLHRGLWILFWAALLFGVVWRGSGDWVLAACFALALVVAWPLTLLWKRSRRPADRNG